MSTAGAAPASGERYLTEAKKQKKNDFEVGESEPAAHARSCKCQRMSHAVKSAPLLRNVHGNVSADFSSPVLNARAV